MGAEHSFNHLANHREPERIGTPARRLDGGMEFGLAKQHLGVMPGARP
jgi:hypothetical protein